MLTNEYIYTEKPEFVIDLANIQPIEKNTQKERD